MTFRVHPDGAPPNHPRQQTAGAILVFREFKALAPAAAGGLNRHGNLSSANHQGVIPAALTSGRAGHAGHVAEPGVEQPVELIVGNEVIRLRTVFRTQQADAGCWGAATRSGASSTARPVRLPAPRFAVRNSRHSV